jgi:hypothetical protein
VQARALGLLFLGIAAALFVVAVAALLGSGDSTGRFVIAVAAVTLAVWLGTLALSALRR